MEWISFSFPPPPPPNRASSGLSAWRAATSTTSPCAGSPARRTSTLPTSRPGSPRAAAKPRLPLAAGSGVAAAGARPRAGGVGAGLRGARGKASLPVGVGFGIRDGETARAVGAVADAVVIGSRLIQEMEEAPPGAAIERAGAFLAGIRRALDGAAQVAARVVQ